MRPTSRPSVVGVGSNMYSTHSSSCSSSPSRSGCRADRLLLALATAVGSGFGQTSEAAIGPAERDRRCGFEVPETLHRQTLPCFKLVAHTLLAAHWIIACKASLAVPATLAGSRADPRKQRKFSEATQGFHQPAVCPYPLSSPYRTFWTHFLSPPMSLLPRA